MALFSNPVHVLYPIECKSQMKLTGIDVRMVLKLSKLHCEMRATPPVNTQFSCYETLLPSWACCTLGLMFTLYVYHTQ